MTWGWEPSREWGRMSQAEGQPVQRPRGRSVPGVLEEQKEQLPLEWREQRQGGEVKVAAENDWG